MSFFNIYKMCFKNPNNVVCKIKNERKIKISFYNKFKLNDIYNKEYIESQLIDYPLFNNMYEFIKSLILTDIRKLLSMDIEFDTFFPCIFSNGNLAWFSKNNEGKIRYFTKRENTIEFFDAIDILQVYYGTKNISTLLNIIIKNYSISFINEAWVNKQRMKYFYNLDKIHNWDVLKKNYPNLVELTKDHLMIYETLNVLGNVLIKKESFGVNGESVFFLSNSYLSKFCNISQSKTNKIINLFSCLGFLNKINETQLPFELIYESKKIAKQRNLGNVIMYYTVPQINKILQLAEKNAKILIDNGIDYKKISKNNIQKIFGISYASELYPQIIQKNKLKKKNDKIYDYAKIKKTILKNILKKGYCTKISIINSMNDSLSSYKKEKIFREVKENILFEKKELIYKKPSKDDKIKFHIKTDEYIFIVDYKQQ